MTPLEKIRITAMLSVLREVIADGYGGKTIDNIVVQLESRKKEAEKHDSD